MKNYSICPLSNKCGGCQLQDYSYSEQLDYKMNYLEDTLGYLSLIAPIVRMEDPTNYRNKNTSGFF